MDKLEEKYNESLTTQFSEMDKKITDVRRQHMKAGKKCKIFLINLIK